MSYSPSAQSDCMSETRRIFKNTAALLVAQLTERGGAFLFTLLLLRTLHASGLGVYSAAVALHGLAVVIAEMGAPNLIVRELAKDRTKANRYILHCSIMGIVSGGGMTALLTVVIPYLGYSVEMAQSIHIALLAIIPGTLIGMQQAVFVAYQRVELQTYVACIFTILQLGTGYYLLSYGYAVTSLVVAFVVGAYGVAICRFFIIHAWVVPLRWEFHSSFALALLRELRVFAASSMLGGLLARPEIIILSFVETAAQVGLYSAALKLADVWNLLPDAYMANVFPVLSRSYYRAEREAQAIQNQAIQHLLTLSLPLAVGVAMIARPVVLLVYGPEFESASVLLCILTWSLPLSYLHCVFWRILIARGNQDANVRAQTITAVARLSSGCVLVRMFGGLGAATTTVMNLLLHCCLLAYFIRKDGIRLYLMLLSWRPAAATLIMGAFLFVASPQRSLWALIPEAIALYLSSLIVLHWLFRPAGQGAPAGAHSSQELGS